MPSLLALSTVLASAVIGSSRMQSLKSSFVHGTTGKSMCSLDVTGMKSSPGARHSEPSGLFVGGPTHTSMSLSVVSSRI